MSSFGGTAIAAVIGRFGSSDFVKFATALQNKQSFPINVLSKRLVIAKHIRMPLTRSKSRLDADLFSVHLQWTTLRHTHDFYRDESTVQWMPCAFLAMLAYNCCNAKKQILNYLRTHFMLNNNESIEFALLCVNTWTFVNDHNAMLIGKLHRFLRIWVM